MSAPRRWLEDPSAPPVGRELVHALKTEPLNQARKDRLYRGLLFHRLRMVPLWLVLLLGAAAAAGSYAVLQRPRPLDADMALFERGVITREQGRVDAALAIFVEYGARYPRGPLAAEAYMERIDALIALGRRDEARREAQRFKAEFPGSPLAPP
jgi:hypothetical protein